MAARKRHQGCVRRAEQCLPSRPPRTYAKHEGGAGREGEAGREDGGEREGDMVTG